jgi:riboflavin synthase
MFTGLIEGLGTLVRLMPAPEGLVLMVETPLASEVRLGESVAVNGVCLTVTGTDAGSLTADVGPETLRVTNLGLAAVGDRVNLERAMRGDSRFGGHFVQGHVDDVGVIERIWEQGEARWLTVAYPPAGAPCLIAKGSVALDGVSLTVAALREGQFDVMIIPYTWAHTNLASRKAGDRVNLEYDVVGKYVARAAQLAGLMRQP